MERQGLYDKTGIIFEILKQYAALYELGHSALNGGKPVNKLGEAIEKFNEVAGFVTKNGVIEVLRPLDDCQDSANKMAIDFLEWVFNDAPQPEWAKEGS